MILLTQCEGSFSQGRLVASAYSPFKLMSLPPTMAAFRPDYQRAYYQVTLFWLLASQYPQPYTSLE